MLLSFVLLASDGLEATAKTPQLLEPTDNEVTTMSIPHFLWQPILSPTPAHMGSYAVQIAADPEFRQLVDEDRIAAVIHRYVPGKELADGDYWWRVATVDATGTRGEWSTISRFSVKTPQRLLRVSADSSFTEIQQVIAEAASQTNSLVQFERSDYRLDPAGAEAFIDLSDATNLTIDGGGSTFTFVGLLTFVRLSHCRCVAIRNFTFDFDPLPYTAGHVLSADTKAGTFDIEIATDHPLPESHHRFAEDRKGMIIDPSGPRMKIGVRLILEHAGWQRIKDRRYRFTAANPRQLAELGPGDVYVLDPRIATGFDVNACDQVVFYKLVAHAIANEGFNSHYGNRLSILHCGIRLKPHRFIAANNGGHNHHNARIGPWIEGCVWENTGDDICHVNCLVMGVEKQLSPKRIRIPLNNPYDRIGRTISLDIQPGDLLQFYNRAEGRLLGERKVDRVSPSGKSLDVTLDGDINDVVPGRPGVKRTQGGKTVSDASITQVFNASRTCNQFVFRNNTVRNGRRIGVLAKGHGGLIENNLFEGLGGGAVEFWNAPFEGLGAVDYVIRRNRIIDCGLLNREHAAIWATIFKSGTDRLHRNLLIADNEIRNFGSTPILLRDAEGAVLRDNQIVVSASKVPAAKAILLHNTQDMQLETNTIEERDR